MRWLLTAALLCNLLSGQDATATETVGSCLPDAVPFENRKYLSIDSREIPVGFWKSTWASATLTQEVGQLLVREVLGYHTTTTGVGSSSAIGLYAVAGCTTPLEYRDTEAVGCSTESHPRSPTHVHFEQWGYGMVNTLELRFADMPEIMPELVGEMGYSGTQGMYVFEKEREAAYAAHGLALEYYRSWDRHWQEPWIYFDKIMDVNASRLRKCEDTRLNDASIALEYYLATLDEEGIERDEETGEVARLRCWNGSWFVSPACRDDLSKCSISITGGNGWGYEDNMQRLFFYNMPIALATAIATSEWGDIGTTYRGPHYWYEPDDTFISNQPTRIKMPEYNSAEHMMGIRSTETSATPLHKWTWNKLADVAPRVHSFVHLWDFPKTQLENILLDYATNKTDPPEAVACRWVQQNRDLWETWIPSSTDCVAGTGLVDSTGHYVGSLTQGAVTCEFCPPGRFSMSLEAEGTRSCELCPPGSHQEAPLQIDCNPCAPGHFGPASGLVTCDICEEGKFQANTWASACERCPGSATTRLLAATSAEQCACPSGSYQGPWSMSEAMNLSANGTFHHPCLACPAGMVCDLGSRQEWLVDSPPGANYPRLEEGYMSRPSQPLKVYKCLERARCPGGRVGTCANRRDTDSVACAQCESGSYEAFGGSCRQCDGWQSTSLMILAPFIIIGGLLLLSWAANKEKIAEANASASCAIVAGLTCTSIQTMSALGNLEVEWQEPMKSCLNFLSVFGFDISIVGLNCFVEGGTGAFIMRQLLAPVLAVVLCIITLVKKYINPAEVEVNIHCCNAMGSLFMLFFISIVFSSVMPLMCYKHPDGNGFSMVQYNEVLCFTTSRHATMLTFGLLALGLVAVPFFGVVIWATLRYPKFLAASQMSNSLQLRRFYFLFRRFEPSAYYYGNLLLTKSLLICLVPVVFRDNGPAQILGLTAVLGIFVFVQTQIRPWRGRIPNAMDAVIALLMIMVMVLGALSLEQTADDDSFKTTISVFGHACLTFFLVVFIIGVSIVITNRLTPRPYYARFICHHKAGAAAQARFLQLLLQTKSQQSCFLDSDDLTNLDELFDVVRSRVGLLIVYMTRDVLRRPWCAGEITTAYKAKVKVIRVITHTFLPPMGRSLLQPFDNYMDQIGKEFMEAGIIEKDLVAAFKWVLSDSIPAVHIKQALCGTQKLTTVAQELLKLQKKGLAQVATPALVPFRPASGSVLISTQVGDEEATAVAGILSVLLQEWALNQTGHALFVLSDVPEIAAETMSVAGLQEIIATCKATIVVLTGGSLSSKQLSGILLATQIMQSTQAHEVISVATPQFSFPSDIYYNTTLSQVLEEGLDALHATELLQLFFRRISIRFTPAASRNIIETEADEIRKRIISDKKRHAGEESRTYAQSSLLQIPLSSTTKDDSPRRAEGSPDNEYIAFKKPFAPIVESRGGSTTSVPIIDTDEAFAAYKQDPAESKLSDATTKTGGHILADVDDEDVVWGAEV